MAEGANPYAMLAKAGLGLFGGFFGARRAGQGIKRAGTTLNEAYRQAAEDAWKLPGYVNPGIARAYGQAGEDVYNQAYGGAANIEARANQARGDVAAGLAQGRGDITGAVGQGREDITGALQQGRGDLAGYLDPYARAGEGALTSLSELAGAKAPTLEQLQMDPGYAWRLEQGQQALERSAAGRGGLQSGATLKALSNYAQGAASQEYANAFDRYMRGQEQRRQSLTTLAGLGGQAAATAGTTLANLGLRGAETMGQMGLQGAETLGQLGLRGAESMGRFGMEGTKTAGDWLNEAARWKGRAGIDSELAQAGNIINAHNAATGYGLNASGATAASQQGLGNVWGDFYSQAGNTLGDLAGGMLQQPQQWPNQGRIPGLPTQYSIPGSPSYNDYYPDYWNSRRRYP